MHCHRDLEVSNMKTLRLTPSISKLAVWLIDLDGNVAACSNGLSLLARIRKLLVPHFSSTEEAMEWGSNLNTSQRATLLDVLRTVENAAGSASTPQRMVDLATRSQLIREACESFANGCGGVRAAYSINKSQGSRSETACH